MAQSDRTAEQVSVRESGKHANPLLIQILEIKVEVIYNTWIFVLKEIMIKFD